MGVMSNLQVTKTLRGGSRRGRGGMGAMLTAEIIGDKALDRKLRALGGKVAQKAIAAGIRAGLTVNAKEIRRQINATDASPELKRAARQTIGKRFNRGGTSRIGKTTQTVAKAGFAVGKKRGAKKGESKSRGAGLGPRNIHWAVLGTDERAQKAGHATGRMPAIFKEVVKKAFAISADIALGVARTKIWQVIKREAQKRG